MKKNLAVSIKEIYVDKEDNYLKGIDHILKAKDGYPIRYALDFTLIQN